MFFMSQLPSISVVIPCWGRINGTRSIITNVLNQTIYNWEAIIIGDGCPDFQSLIDSGEMENFAQRAKNLNSQIIYKNLEEHKGGWGYECLNTAIDLARSKFLIFAANDDLIYPNHFENYLREIENTDENVGIVAFRTVLHRKVLPYFTLRIPGYRLGYIGHSECIFRTEGIKAAPRHLPVYGHDWALIENIVKEQKKELIIIIDNEPTYQVEMRE